MEATCIHKVFDDFDAFTEAAHGWDIDFKQLQAKPFGGELLQYIQGNVHFARAQLNNRIEQLGNPPKGLRTFAIPTKQHLRLNWLGVTVPDDSILVFQPQRGLDCVSWNDFDMFVFSMPEDQISQLCFELGYPALPATIERSDIIRCRPDSLAALRRLLATITHSLERSPDHTAEWIQKEIKYTIPMMLLQTLASAQKTTTARHKRMRDIAIGQIRTFINTSINEPLKVTDLCNQFHISERTLEYAFRDHFGTSPKAYIKMCRLNQVRKALRQSPQQRIKITDIANHFGFWHMGQFAADYKKLFGELPSETFKPY